MYLNFYQLHDNFLHSSDADFVILKKDVMSYLYV